MLTLKTAASLPPPQYSYQPCHNPLSTFSTAWSLHPQEKKKNNPNRPTCSSEDTVAQLCSPATPPNDRSYRGGRRKQLKQICSIKVSAQEEIYLHQSAKDCQNLPSIYLQSWEESREVWPPRLSWVSACRKNKCSQFRSYVSWSCAVHRKYQSVPQYLVLFEIPFKASLRVSKTR